MYHINRPMRTSHLSQSESIASRVSTGKTMVWGTWDAVRPALDAVFQSYFVFPMGSVPKLHQPSARRATSGVVSARLRRRNGERPRKDGEALNARLRTLHLKSYLLQNPVVPPLLFSLNWPCTRQ